VSTRGRPNKRRPAAGMTNGEVLVVLVSLVGLCWLALAAWLSAELAGTGHGNPISWLADSDGTGRWNTAATGWALLFGAGTIVGVTPVAWLAARSLRRRQWTDSLAPSMSSGRDLQEMTENAVAADTARLGSSRAGIGLRLGRAVLNGVRLFGTFEWSQLWILGTRAGKTRCVAIPQLVEHHGPAVTTSNKRDVHDLTRGPRSELGRCWVNDPQQIAQQPADWWWNPLTFITTTERSAKLVDIWAAARSSADMAGADPYFEPEGRRLLQRLMMAAALAGEYVTRLPDWLTGYRPGPGVPDPVAILREHGYHAQATGIESTLELAPDQKDGLYGTARSFVGFLDAPEFVVWMAPTGPDDTRPEFSPTALVRSTGDTLYLLSKDGPGSARALTAALTAAVYEEGEEHAEKCGGRVPIPILFMLDEAANICRWPELPNLYSHAGSKGLILVTILQSEPQGEQAWGKADFRKMWSAANVLAVGRGINDESTLTALAKLVGDRQIADHSRSVGGRGHRSTSHSNRDERIFTEADLRALPRGRTILMTSGARAILLETIDYSQHPWAYKAEASKTHFGPQTGQEVTADA